MDVVFSNWAWLSKEALGDRKLRILRGRLLIEPRRTSVHQDSADLAPVPLYRERPGFIGIPRQYFLDTRALSHKLDLSRLSKGRLLDLDFKGKLLNDQKKAKETVLVTASTGGVGGILQAKPGWGKCQSVDSLVQIKGKGLVEIGSLMPSTLDKEYCILDEMAIGKDSKYHSVEQGYRENGQDVLRVVTSAGHRLEATHEHPIYVVDPKTGKMDWKRLDDVQVGDYAVIQLYDIDGSPVEITGDYGSRLNLPCFVSDDLARLMGYLTGDGCLTAKGRTSISNSCSRVVDDTREIARDIGLELKGGPQDWHLYSIDLKRFLEWAGCKSVLAGEKEVPWVVFQGGRSIVINFLRAYFETDGGVDVDGCRVENLSKSRKLAFGVQQLLQGLRIPCVVRPRNVKYKGEIRVYWRMRIDGCFLERFREVVGFVTPKYHEMLDGAIERYGSTTRNPNRYLAPVSLLMRGLYKYTVDLDSSKPRGCSSRFNAWERCQGNGFLNCINQKRVPSVKKAREFLDVFIEFLSTPWWIEIDRIISNDDYWYVPIESIEDGGTVDVADIVVPEGHSFIANGFVSHNTVAALGIWLGFGTTCVVVVNREFLRDQWIERIEQFVPDARVGVIQGNRCEIGDDYDISIAMIHSLSSRQDTYPEELWKWPGLLITDETHAVAAKTWMEVVPTFYAAFRLGLTATPRRKDGMENVFFWHIGKVIYESNVYRDKPKLRRQYTGYQHYVTPKFNPNDASRPIQLRFLLANKARNALITSELVKAAKTGRKIIVLSERRKHLEILRDLFAVDKQKGCVVDFFVGGRSRAELKTAEHADILFCCVEDGTECLTLDGWKKRDDLMIGEMVASYNMKRGVIEYSPLLEVSSYHHRGFVKRVDKKRVNVRMTYNHRNVVLHDGVECIRRADELVARDKIRLIAPVDYPESLSIGGDMAELLGWVISEGTYKSNNGRGVVIYQNAGEHADRITRCLDNLGIDYRLSNYRGDELSWHIHEDVACETIKKLCPDKDLSRDLVSIPIDELKRMFDGLIDGDGNRDESTGAVRFIQKKKSTVDWFTVMALRLGFGSLLHEKAGGCSQVLLSAKEHVGTLYGKVSTEHYDGIMWCPRTKNGTWIARSNGSMFITGNTYQMAKEALDISTLDTAFLVSPMSDVEQACGRIMRYHPDKRPALIVDFIDEHVRSFVRAWNQRKRFYVAEGIFKDVS